MEDIAIVGYSFKLPQDVNDESMFWDVLQNRRNLMTKWPESRINAASFDSDKHSKVCRTHPYIITSESHIAVAPLPGRTFHQ